MSPTEITFWIVFVGGILGALFNPTYGVLLYILVYSIRPEEQWWGGHVVQFGLRTSFIVALATAIGMVLKWRTMRKTETQFPWMFRLMILFLLYAFLTSVTEEYPLGHPSSAHYIDKAARVYIFIYMMIRIVRTSIQFRWLLWAWLAGTIYIGYQAWSGVGVTAGGRLTGGLGGPDFASSSGLAAHLVAMIAIAGFLYYSSKSKYGKFFALLAAAYAVNTIVLTRTRNVVPGVLAMTIFGLVHLPKGVRLKCAAGVIVGFALALQLADQGWWNRMSTLKNPEQDPAVVLRFDFWDAAVRMARDHPFGVGPGRFRDHVNEYIPYLIVSRSAHSTYFQCLAELGYPGTILFIGVLVAAFWQFERARSIGKKWQLMLPSNPDLATKLRELLLMATANEVAIAGYLVSAAFTSRLWTEGLWLLLAMSCCLYNISQGMYARVHEAAPQPEVKSQTPPFIVPGVVGT